MLRTARSISIILHPFVIAALMFIYLPLRAGYSGFDLIGASSLLFLLSFIIPLLYLLNLKRTSRIDDLDIKDRIKRHQHYVAFLVLYVIQFLLALMVFDSSILWAYTFAIMFNTFIFGLINMKWKISIHGAGLGGPIGVLLFLQGLHFWPLSLLLPPLVWSRVKLEYHSTAQVVTGAVLSGGLIYLEFILITSIWPPTI